MSLDHLWTSCPAYDVKCLRDATTSKLALLTPKIYVKYTDLDGSSMQWSTLLSLQRLDRALMLGKHQSTLKDMLPLREWTYRCYLWHLWKCHNKEIYDPDYLFVPASTLPQLTAMFDDFHNSY